MFMRRRASMWLPIGQFDQRLGLTRAFPDALDDPRDPDLTEHTFLEMVRSRVYGILADYADQNDHDTLRAAPVFKLMADRSPGDSDLARQPTLSRFENAINIESFKRLRDVFLDQFIASFDTPPRHLTFDLDAIDGPAHADRAWPAAHLSLLEKLTDAEVAARTGRGANAVRVKRTKLGIPNPSSAGWTAEELAPLGTAPDAKVAERIGRSEGAVTLKRCRLGIPTCCDRRRDHC
jgi:hypothetical protein